MHKCVVKLCGDGYFFCLLSVYYNLNPANPQMGNAKMKNAIIILPATYVAIPDHLQSNFTEPKVELSHMNLCKILLLFFVEGSIS